MCLLVSCCSLLCAHVDGGTSSRDEVLLENVVQGHIDGHVGHGLQVVQGQAAIEPSRHALVPCNCAEAIQRRCVEAPRPIPRLHSPAHDVKRVNKGLGHEAGDGARPHTLGGREVRL
eukprot:scaffold1969_cov130-Isochrysis_galbana.AAC.5